MSAQTASESVSHKAHSSTLSKVFAMREAGTLAALVLMVLVIAIVIPQFRQWENVVNITRNFSFVGTGARAGATASGLSDAKPNAVLPHPLSLVFRIYLSR